MRTRSSTLTPLRFAAVLLLLLAALGVTLVVCPLVGATKIDLSRALDRSIPPDQNADRSILFLVRLPRVILAGLVGACLAAAGVAFQAILKNDLATPYTLGISGGGALGAVLVLYSGVSFSFLGISSLPLASFAGSFAAMLLVYAVARRREGVDTVTLLLVGVMVNFFFSALTLLVNYLADMTQSFRIVRWLMGGLDMVDYPTIFKVLPFMAFGVAGLVSCARRLNLLSLGEETARSLGVNLRGTMRIVFFAASLATGASVAVSGPIGFVGLLVPHAMRALIGPDHRLLIPASLLAGACFLTVCDTLARTLFAPTELPVGVITALLGVPFFLYLITRKRYAGAVGVR